MMMNDCRALETGGYEPEVGMNICRLQNYNKVNEAEVFSRSAAIPGSNQYQ